MSKAPDICLYCNNRGYQEVDGQRFDCGFCDNGSPLDSQEDWDNSWGKVFDLISGKEMDPAFCEYPNCHNAAHTIVKSKKLCLEHANGYKDFLDK